MPAAASAWRKPCSRRRADSRSGRPARKPIGGGRAASRCSVASAPPRRLSESTVGRSDGPLWVHRHDGAPLTSTTVGVTRIAPSMSVPETRASERRSQPTLVAAAWPRETTRS